MGGVEEWVIVVGTVVGGREMGIGIGKEGVGLTAVAGIMVVDGSLVEEVGTGKMIDFWGLSGQLWGRFGVFMFLVPIAAKFVGLVTLNL